MRINYISKNFRPKSRAIIQKANDIIYEYQDQGYSLTLRQLYYQFVARDLIPNKQSEYKNLGSIVNDARLSGEISWKALEDRTRNIKRNSHWDTPSDILKTAASAFAMDKWDTQNYYIEVWIEKDALVGVISNTCEELDISHFSCRGYVSQSEMWEAGQRFNNAIEQGKKPILLHLGDHDPSGIDMTWDIWKRLNLFADYPYEEVFNRIDRETAMNTRNFDFFDGGVNVKRLALNSDQIEEYTPPPNPAKLTDSRIAGYSKVHGMESWELDALEPKVLTALIEDEVLDIRDETKWDESLEEQENKRKIITDFISTLKE